jgi:hypothetical protein
MPNLVDLRPEQRQDVGSPVRTASHALASLPLFSDDALIELLDRHPKEHLRALAVSDDPARPDLQPASHDDLAGEDLWRAVHVGRLVLNLTRVDLSHRRYRELVRSLYGELAAVMPGVASDSVHGSMLIASPGTVARYHVDTMPTVLWTIRGTQRLWVYPALDRRFLASEVLEDIIAGVRHEYLPYEPSFDSAATVLDLAPGTLVAWPHAAPHRWTTGESVSVALSTEHATKDSRRLGRLLLANRFLRTHFGASRLSPDPRGTGALPKMLAHKATLLLGLDYRPQRAHVPELRIQPSAPRSVVSLDAEAPRRRLVVRECSELEAVAPYRDRLDALNAGSARPCPFSTFDYIATAWRNREERQPGAACRLMWLLIFDGEALVGHLPLERSELTKLGVRCRTVRLVTAREADRPHIVAARRDAQRVRDAIYRHLVARPNWDVLELADQDEASALAFVPGFVRDRYQVRTHERQGSVSIALRWASLGEYVQGLPKSLRTSLTRSLRRLLLVGEIELVRVEGGAAMPRALEHYLDVEARSWKHIAGESIQRDPRRLAFFRELVTPGQPMPVQLALVALQGVPIAGMLTGTFGGDLYALQTTCEEACADLGPAQLLSLHLIARAISARMRRVHLLPGAPVVSERWQAETAPLVHVEVLRPGSFSDWQTKATELRRVLADQRSGIAAAPPDFDQRQPMVDMPVISPDIARRRAAFRDMLATEPGIVRQGPEQLAAMLGAALDRPTRRRAREAYADEPSVETPAVSAATES